MPRLLIVTTVPKTFWFLHPFVAHFQSLGWTVDALTGPSDDFEDRSRFDRAFIVDWSRNPLDVRNLLLAPARVRQVVADRGYDIVHVHTPVAAFVTRLALRRRNRELGPRVVYTAHGFRFHPGGRLWTNAAFFALEKLAAQWTDYLVVMNREDAAAGTRLLPPNRVRVMPGIGVDVRHYTPERVDPAEVRAFRNAVGVGDDPCFLMVAEFIARKRQTDLLRAFADVAADASLPRAHLLFAGDGPWMEKVRATACELGLERRTHFLGVQRDIRVVMRASAALVLSSEQEGLPRCILEAMCMGLPVIGTRIRGTAELLEGGCGYLYEVADTAALALLLRRVLVQPAVAAASARLARERVGHYEERNVILLHEGLYAEVLGTGPALTSSGQLTNVGTVRTSGLTRSSDDYEGSR
jgi:glycosyltransferase involved in cell wall biosynthesis